MTDEIPGATPAPVAPTGDVSGQPTGELATSTPGETPSTPGSQPEKPAEPKKTDPRQRKIAELSYHNRELERRLDRVLGILETSSRPKGDEAPPKPDQFGTLDEYIDAKVQYQLKQDRKPKGEDKPKAGTESGNEPEAGYREAVEDLRLEGTDKYPDFEDKFESARYITQAMAQAILESEDRADVAYALFSDQAEAWRISKLSPLRQAAEIGKLEAKLSITPPKKPSSAPAPITPTGGAAANESGLSDAEDIKTWMKKRNKQVRGK
jgi:hypothetical protein